MRVEGYVLTGGRSSRFGSDKALYTVNGRAMALHVADALSGLANTVTLVGDPGRYGLLGLPVVPDRFPGAGPLGGIVTALANASSPWILVVACDHAQAVRRPLGVVARPGGLAQTCGAVLPRTPDGRLQPLCAAYARSALGPLADALRRGTRKVMEAVQTVPWRAIEMDDSAPFANVNRPSDLIGLG